LCYICCNHFYNKVHLVSFPTLQTELNSDVQNSSYEFSKFCSYPAIFLRFAYENLTRKLILFNSIAFQTAPYHIFSLPNILITRATPPIAEAQFLEHYDINHVCKLAAEPL